MVYMINVSVRINNKPGNAARAAARAFQARYKRSQVLHNNQISGEYGGFTDALSNQFYCYQ
jgi:hypothetical protein